MNPENTYAFAFSGIEPLPDQYAIEFYLGNKAEFDPYLETASDFIQMDLKKHLSGENEQPADPLINQIHTYTYGVSMSNFLIKTGIKPALVCGFSLGVYAALAVAEIVSFQSGLRMVNKAYELMDALSGKNNYGMSAIVGLNEPEIQTIITENGLNSLHRANTLSETCAIFSGDKNELAALQNAAQNAGCLNAVSLDVDIPYHHPQLLEKASAEFAGFLDTLEWKKSSIPLVSSITQDLLTDSQDIRKFIALNLSQPIHWQKVIEKVASEKCDFLIECGPGLTLTRNGRFIDSELKYINVKNIGKKLSV